jgi:hypothetical protein
MSAWASATVCGGCARKQDALTLEVDDFHALLDMREGMMRAFILQGINLGFRKVNLYHRVLTIPAQQ